MRWDALFSDLDAQADALERTQRAAEVADRMRIELTSARIVDRLAVALGAPMRVHCSGDLVLSGVARRVGPDWLLLEEGSGREALLALPAVMRFIGLTRFSAIPRSEGSVAARLGLSHALRAIVRDRSTVRVSLVDGATITGTLDRVGADFVDLAVHPPDEARRREAVREHAVVPLGALSAVRRDAP